MIKQKYLDYAFHVADIVWDSYGETRKKGFEEACELLRSNGAFMNPLRFAGTVAPGEVMRYKQTGDKQYLERARTYLLDVYEINSELTAYQQRENITVRNNDFPMLDWMFDPEPYINAYNMIKEEACFTEDEVRKIEKVVELSLAPILKMPEYGPMNRSMLRINMKQNAELIQLLMTAEEILIQSFRAIRETHITLMSVFLRKNLIEHIALQQNHSVE